MSLGRNIPGLSPTVLASALHATHTQDGFRPWHFASARCGAWSPHDMPKWSIRKNRNSHRTKKISIETERFPPKWSDFGADRSNIGPFWPKSVRFGPKSLRFGPSPSEKFWNRFPVASNCSACAAHLRRTGAYHSISLCGPSESCQSGRYAKTAMDIAPKKSATKQSDLLQNGPILVQFAPKSVRFGPNRSVLVRNCSVLVRDRPKNSGIGSKLLPRAVHPPHTRKKTEWTRTKTDQFGPKRTIFMPNRRISDQNGPISDQNGPFPPKTVRFRSNLVKKRTILEEIAPFWG